MNSAAAAPLAYASRPLGRAANDNEGLIVDLFAGGGGASEAILFTTGRHPDIAVNHDAEAIGMHEVNHPTTLHLQDDIRRVDIPAVLARFNNRHVDVMWASPDCKDHSVAKGGALKDQGIRGLAWEVLRWTAAIRRCTGRVPTTIFLENVWEFQDWGPLHRMGKRAGKVQKNRRKELFRKWVSQLEALGFVVEYRRISAADFGAPTTRTRLFLVARSDGQPIVWPKPTHAPRAKIASGESDLLPWGMAAQIINWNIPVPSIFGRKRPLKAKTRARIAKGIRRYVIESPKPFIVNVTHTKSDGGNVYDSADPLRSQTTAKGGEFAITVPSIAPLTHGGGEDRVHSMEDPAHTVTAAHRGETALFAPVLVPRYGEAPGQEPRAKSVEAPYPVVVPTGNGGDLAGVFMQKMAENGIGYPMTDPAHTAMAGAPRHYQVAAILDRNFGSARSGRSLEEPHPAVMTEGGGGKSSVVAASLGRMAKGSFGGHPEEPTKTLMTKSKDFLASIYMDQHNGDGRARSAEEPVTSLTQRSTQQKLAVAQVDKYYGTGVPQRTDRPLDAVTSKGRFGLNVAHIEQANTGMIGRQPDEPVSTIVSKGCTQRLIETTLEEVGALEGSTRLAVLEFLWEHFGAPTAEEWEDPMATAMGRLRFGLVEIDGMVWQIVDIGMRMLVPRELYNAQGFWHFERTIRVNICPAQKQYSANDPARPAEPDTGPSFSPEQPVPVLAHARIDFGRSLLEISSHAKSASSAKNAAPLSSSLLPADIESSARTVARHLFGLGPPAHAGASPPSASNSTPQTNGVVSAFRSGAATTPLAGAAGPSTSTEAGSSKSTTSPAGPGSQSFDEAWTTLCSFAADAIASSIRGPTATGNSYAVELTFEDGYVIDVTLSGKPITKTGQTRMAGNSVSPPPAMAVLSCNVPERVLMKMAA